jgi:7,8-dihydro-6-hydroxymethylpterin-pyrophosphokinase
MILWKLPELLKREGVTAYRLNKELKGHAATNTAYRWAREMPRTIDIDVLRWTIDALERITGKEFQVTDLLEFQRVQSGT